LKVTEAYVPRTTEWDLIHVRLAYLLHDEKLFKDLAEYYEQARELNENAAKYEGISTNYVVGTLLPKLKEASDRVRPQLQQFYSRRRQKVRGSTDIVGIISLILLVLIFLRVFGII